MKSAVLIYSGGLDSTVLLYHLAKSGYHVRALSINYAQRHKTELEYAAAICKDLGIEHKVVDLSSLSSIMAGSSQTDPNVEVPEGHYEEESMKLTVVPNRNMVLLAVAGAWAIQTKSDHIAYAAHGGDHAIYPDCRPEFAKAMDDAIQLADWHKVTLIRPFVDPVKMSKSDIVTLGRQIGVPFARTWSCYKGRGVHCGRCGTCTERIEAFKLAGVEDPTEYSSAEGS